MKIERVHESGLALVTAGDYHSLPARCIRIGQIRRGDRVADCAGLEIQCGSNITVGSNPTLSAHLTQCLKNENEFGFAIEV
jgi:hypothetical protein